MGAERYSHPICCMSPKETRERGQSRDLESWCACWAILRAVPAGRPPIAGGSGGTFNNNPQASKLLPSLLKTAVLTTPGGEGFQLTGLTSIS